jgi:predicted dehydrogenase
MDVNLHRAASLYETYGLRYYTDDAKRIVEDPAIDLVFIASNHASHADYAVDALRAGKSVHIEKPHAVDRDQLRRICLAMSESAGKVSLGFNRPKSRIGRMIKNYLDSQSGAALFSWFVAGHKLGPDHWYLRDGEGGRVLGNLCHWTDFTLWLVAPERRYPIVITPTRCDAPDCDIAVTYVFGDKSVAALVFGARGEPFEGIREQFAAQRGDVLISMMNFENLRIDLLDRRIRYSPLFRDQGHESTIVSSYAMVRPKPGQTEDGCRVEDIWETGNLFLRTKDALDANKQITIHSLEDFQAWRREAHDHRRQPA